MPVVHRCITRRLRLPVYIALLYRCTRVERPGAFSVSRPGFQSRAKGGTVSPGARSKGEDMAEPGIVQDEQKLKQRAMRRLAIALTFIALAIAGLAILDRYNASLKKPEMPTKPPE